MFMNKPFGSKRCEPFHESEHLCEAFAITEAILARYQRGKRSFTSSEKSGLAALIKRIPYDILVEVLDQSGFTPTSNATPPVDYLAMMEHTMTHGASITHALQYLNDLMTKCTGCPGIRTYYHNPNDDVLADPVHDTAALIDETTAVGKSVVTKQYLNIAGAHYIPLIHGDIVVGCVEVPRFSGNLEELPSFPSLIRAVTCTAHKFIEEARINWNREKAEAMLQMATRLARDNLDETVLASSIMNTVKSLTESARCSLFLVKDDKLEAHFEDGNVVSIPKGTGIVGYVAQTGETVNIVDAYADDRFNREVDKATGYRTKTILCMPVMYEGTIVAVTQLINKLDLTTESGLRLPRVFGKRDEELFQTFSMFAGASLRNCRINDRLLKEKKKSDVILDVVTVLSNTDIRDVDGIVRHALHGAKKLLNADRSTLFLVDKERNELCSRMADSVAGKEIRFPCGQGIAGTVAASGVGENIQDAYQDPRFNREVDKQLGYRTQTILCEPIILNGEILAVVQLVNKLDTSGEVTVFTEDDRETFRVFSLFAGISINNSHLLEFAVKAGREVMELNEHRATLFNKNVPSRAVKRVTAITKVEREAVLVCELPSFDVTDVEFDLFRARDTTDKPLDVAAAIAYRLLLGSGLPQKFGCSDEVLLNFILQCRKKYRNVPYHNFYHVVDVCQTIHTFLYRGNVYEKLTELECFVLLITALVHDLDHMGLNNSFYLKTESPLGILSSASGNTSVLEVHHCNLAVEILSDPESDVFGGLEGAERTLAFRSMIDCVLATDMAKHGSALEAFLASAADQSSDEAAFHRMTMEILLKAGDISNVTKPFDISRQWAMAVTEEFYRQGDMEKERGVEVLPMFDRSKNMELAKGQIGFIDFVAAPFFQKIVDACLQGMQWTVDRIKSNRAQWERVLETRLSTSSGNNSSTR
ncbi:cAMP-specific phosphodiesterase [Trypanosoma brucei brucei TREU927]|uniref:Phosphodiesterase n=1 Tax=Trypanosoma brucei brucei (strain 927/4 GUTat10.1) TaxID=185431 RepID=Q38F46_TRYB2|nr:cAMP-specific phosphodiesterase [Trypanosoma brucei brucei TREU927]EAN76574.1 cAMP-specific phosphodiesterase [Trypanosoma brucei brucei TREU927]